jgi:hypothetical protein
MLPPSQVLFSSSFLVAGFSYLAVGRLASDSQIPTFLIIPLILDKGELYTWGTCGETGRLGHGEFEHCFEPKRVKMPQEKDGHKVIVHDVALGQDGALAIVETK